LGAGLGTGTVCASDGAGAPSDAAINNAKTACGPGTANWCAIGIFGFLFNASSCLAPGPFYRAFGKKEITIFRENNANCVNHLTGKSGQNPPSSSSTRISRLPA
jgi:hypothetical protein